MVFSGLIFTFIFLPLVLMMHYAVKSRSIRNDILLIVSIVFYTYGEPIFVYIMLGSIAANYAAALIIDRFRGKLPAKLFMTATVMLNIGILFIFKYLDLSIDILNRLLHISLPMAQIALPIGISFYTFQALSYVFDVYRGKVQVQKNPLYVALYIAFFPQLIAGPIVRYSSIEKQLLERECTVELFADGVKRFMRGFCKKILIANNLAVISEKTFSLDASMANPLYLWLGAVCFSLQIYYDFSGYSDMAIGLGKMFGFSFDENFDHPYISRSVTEFWRRWHMSLSGWFKDYVYIPLGGNRVNHSRRILNLFIVWMLTGIWHGANYTFIAWGLGYFLLLLLEKELIKPSERKNIIFKISWQIITLLCVNFGWVIFNSKSLSGGIQYCLAMIGYYGIRMSIDGNIIFSLREYGFFIFCALLFAAPLPAVLKKLKKSKKIAYAAAVLEPIGSALLFLWAVSFLIMGAHNPFIYFNF